MKYRSTRAEEKTDFVTALSQGLAKEGGLYVPETLPHFGYDLKDIPETDFIHFSSTLIANFVNDSSLANYVEGIVQQAFNFPLVRKELSSQLSVLELFHGPTLSFKDFGARFLAQCLNKSTLEPFILVATSGDTGSAVASSLSGLKGVKAAILFPKGKISKRQEAQITCWDKNILAIEVEGFFDDCQSLVKQAFSDNWFNEKLNLSTANSINIARLIAQITYYAYQSTLYGHSKNKAINYIVPSGNLGNVTACFYAKLMGFPINNISVACNANKAVIDYLETGVYQSRPTISTLANAMDVGAPSNMERLMDLFNSHELFKSEVKAFSVDDEMIRASIIDMYDKYQYIACPHTAVAYSLLMNSRLSDSQQCIIATAHPAKFEQVIEPILDIKLPIPKQLDQMLGSAHNKLTISPTITALKKAISTHFQGRQG